MLLFPRKKRTNEFLHLFSFVYWWLARRLDRLQSRPEQCYSSQVKSTPNESLYKIRQGTIRSVQISFEVPFRTIDYFCNNLTQIEFELSLGKTVEKPAFVIAEIPVHMNHFWNQLDESFIWTIDVKMIGSSFLRKIFWKRYKNRYFFNNRALEI